jgi:hypothetical protein
MSAKAFTPSAIWDEPLIGHGRVAKREKTFTRMNTTKESEDHGTGEDECGDILIPGFWARGTNCILDVPITTCSLIANNFLLKSWKHTKKKRYKSVLGLAWRDVGTLHLSSIL